MHAYRPDLPRGLCEAMTMHDPLYDETATWERWALCIIVAIAGVAIGAYLYAAGTSPEKTPEPPPAPATIPETRSEIPVGRLVCERWERGGCREWRVYRTVEH